jgi:hypothetical protein
MITAAGMFERGKRLVRWCQPAGNLTPERRPRTITPPPRRLRRSHALHLAIELTIQQCQVLKLLPAGWTVGEMRVHIPRVERGFWTLARLLKQFRQFRHSDVLAGTSFQN